MRFRVWVAVGFLLLAGCSVTPENTHSTADPTGVELIPGCEQATYPDECRRDHKKNGSDVPTVDHAAPVVP